MYAYLKSLNWKTWLALLVVSMPLFFLNVPGQKIHFVDSWPHSNDELGKEFSHGWPFVALHTLKPNYDLDRYRVRSIKGERQYVYAYSDQVGNRYLGKYTRGDLRRTFNRQICSRFYQLDPKEWDESVREYQLGPRDPVRFLPAVGTNFDHTTPFVSHKPNWWYSESWPLGIVGVKFFWSGLAFNVLLWIIVCCIICVLFEKANQLAPKLFKFRLVHLLIMVGLISAILASAINVRRQFESERQVAWTFDEVAGVNYEFDKVGSERWRPAWLTRLIGTGWEQSFFRIRELHFSRTHYSDRETEVISRESRKISSLASIRIDSKTARKLLGKSKVLSNCPNLILIVDEWGKLGEVPFSTKYCESLTLIDLEFRIDMRQRENASNLRLVAIQELVANGFDGKVILNGAGMLTIQELQALNDIGLKNIVLQECSLESKAAEQLLWKLDLDAEQVFVDPGINFFKY